MNIKQLLQIAIDRKASDIHIVPNYLPSIRINNDLVKLTSFDLITKETSSKLLTEILTPEQKENLFTNKEIDFGYQYGEYRFRGNIYFVKNALAAAFRLIPLRIKTFEELNLPQSLDQFTELKQGLILLSGKTGHGKSTTVASMINLINSKYPKHIITIEDPIEYIYKKNKALISQRELHHDTHSWNIALKSALREDPDVVLVGEMRDYESIQLVLTLAETGHLVFSTLHTSSAPEVINRIIDVFPSHQQNQVRNQLSSVLKAVITQTLIPNIDDSNRIPALEIMINTNPVASTIREGKIHMLENILVTSEKEGSILLEKYLLNLYKKGIITKENALKYAVRPEEIKKLLNN